ncbi:hypothetical protein BDY21DRAFT_197662 [Lineolata rhizophorae]|uniref:DUF1763-domain-containing protein n=1 Tax=Lineolata rhizophorae TaxID=578093 RepID=A0A6A6P4L5_9PEZI|nr:hypothetical protein BDY21DRAFT_197662 [Lineolata rhizophorae]
MSTPSKSLVLSFRPCSFRIKSFPCYSAQMPASRNEIVRAYRQLYTQCLRACRYSKPSRYVLRDKLRSSFRNGLPEEFDAQRIANTIEFLDGATRSKGTEHRILKNLTFVWWSQGDSAKNAIKLPKESKSLMVTVTKMDHLNHTVRMLNETMGLCIP